MTKSDYFVLGMFAGSLGMLVGSTLTWILILLAVDKAA